MNKIIIVVVLFYCLNFNHLFAATETIKIYPTDDAFAQLYDEDNISDWDLARNYSGVIFREPLTAGDVDQMVVRSDRGVGTYRIYRTSMVFDTSVIPDDSVIQSASINVYKSIGNNVGGTNLVFTSHTRASTSVLQKEDWILANYGTIAFARGSLIDNAYTEYSLNNNGVDYLNTDNYTIFGALTNFDFDDTGEGLNHNAAAFYSIERAGVTQDPFLEITYSHDVPKGLLELLTELIEKVETGDFDKNERKSYLAHLQSVENMYIKGQRIAAINQLEQFIAKVRNDFFKGEIDPAEGEELIDLAEAVIAIIDATFLDTDGTNVPLITQVESEYPSLAETQSWSSFLYASGTASTSCGTTIAQCGCALASMSMLAKSYGVSEDILGNDINPGNMNTWLLDNNGYTPDGSALWGKILEYFGKQTGDKITTNFTLDTHNEKEKTAIDDFLGENQPVVAFNNRLGHYFVLTESHASGSYSVRDPYWYNTKTTDETKDAASSVQGYNNEVSKANLFTFAKKPEKLAGMIEIHLGSPAELLLTDSDGNRVGYESYTREIVNEIPGSSYDQTEGIFTEGSTAEPHTEKVLMVLKPESETYSLQVIGTGEGEYNLTIYTANNEGSSSVETYASSTSFGMVDTYGINLNDKDAGHGNESDGCDEDNPGEGEECSAV